MINLLFVSLIFMLIYSYVLSGRDFFAPATVQILTFAATVFTCIYFMRSMDCPYDFHWVTIGLIIAAMLMSLVIGIIAHQLFLRAGMEEHTKETVDISPIPIGIHFVVIGFIIITVIWLLSEIRRIGGTSGNFFSIISQFHSKNSYSTDENGRLPWVLNQMLTSLRPLVLLYGFNMIRFYKELSFVQKSLNISILALCFLTMLLTASRTGAVNLMIGCIVIFHLLRIQRDGKYIPYRLKYLFRFVLIIVLIMWAFFLVKNLVGRSGKNETMNVFDYIAYYTGTQYISLDQYLQNPPTQSTIFGKETFYNLNAFLIRYNLSDHSPYLVHLEFRPVGGGFRGNVYTFLRSYHYDFGWVGTFVLHGVSMIFLSVFYEYVKRRRGNMGILIFGQMYYTVVMSFFAERFFSNIVSLNYIKQLLMLLILYELLIRKRIRFKFRRTASSK